MTIRSESRPYFRLIRFSRTSIPPEAGGPGRFCAFRQQHGRRAMHACLVTPGRCLGSRVTGHGSPLHAIGSKRKISSARRLGRAETTKVCENRMSRICYVTLKHKHHPRPIDSDIPCLKQGRLRPRRQRHKTDAIHCLFKSYDDLHPVTSSCYSPCPADLCTGIGVSEVSTARTRPSSLGRWEKTTSATSEAKALHACSVFELTWI